MTKPVRLLKDRIKKLEAVITDIVETWQSEAVSDIGEAIMKARAALKEK